MFFVFVDTQAYRKQAFNFESAALTSLRHAVEDRRITVLTTTITDREIVRLLEKEVTTAFQAVKKALKENYILKAVPVVDLDVIRTTHKEQVAETAKQLWEKYRAAIAPQAVPFDHINPGEVMDAHFEEKPPFSAEKPNEFRDAFVLRALYDWAEAEDQQVIVVSGDGDHAAACDGERLRHVETIADAVALSRDDETIAQQARDALLGERLAIKEQLGEVFGEIPISIEDDPDAYAEDHSIEDFEIEPDEFVLVDFRDGNVIISGPITVAYAFSAKVSDYANGSRIEDEWVYLPQYTYRIESKVVARVAIRMAFGGAPAKPAGVESVTIESPRHISLGLHDHDVDARVTKSWGDDPDW